MRPGAAITVPMAKRAGGAAAEGCVQGGKVGVQYPYFGDHPNYFTSYTCSDWQSPQVPGTVILGPLEAGTYQLFADPSDDALGSQWVGATGGTGDRGAAAQITLAEGARSRSRSCGSTGRLDPGQGDRPLHRRPRAVRLRIGDRRWPRASAATDARSATADDGTYMLPGVGPYAWPVQFAKDGYQWRWSGNAVSRPEATPVTVRAGKNVTANIKVRTGGGTIAGTIHDAAGHRSTGVVTAYNAVTGEAASIGAQAVWQRAIHDANLAPQQQVKLQWSSGNGRYGWVGGTDFASATPLQVKNNKTLTVNITVS